MNERMNDFSAHLLLHRRVHDRRAVQVSAEPPRVARRDQVGIIRIKSMSDSTSICLINDLEEKKTHTHFRWHPGRHQELSRRWQPEVIIYPIFIQFYAKVTNSNTCF